MGTNLLAEISKEFVSGSKEITDVITFVESSWGLGITLSPVQKFTLKATYGMKLNEGEKTIHVPDVVNERILYSFSEREFLRWLYAEKRCNVEETEGHIWQNLILAWGRRSGKCRDKNDLISTTIGSITFGELCHRLGVGEKIGIPTYDQETLTRSVSYDLKADANDGMECFEVQTTRGIREISSWNHPYLIWRSEWENPDFVNMSDLRIGDKIATSACTGLFGEGGIGIAKAALLGHFQGDGGTTCSAGYSTASSVMLEDIRRLVTSEFPGYVVNKKGKASFRLGYDVVKVSGKRSQNGSRNNEVREWLKREGCFGKKAIHKKVPDSILRGTKEEVAAFISRLFGCDGWAVVEKKVQKGHSIPRSYVGYGSSSLELIEGVRHLLLKFGIFCVLRKRIAKCNGNSFQAWDLTISRMDSLEKFRDEIGIFSKEDSVNRVVETSRTRGDAKSEFDCVPIGVWNYVKRTMKERKLTGAVITGRKNREDGVRLRWNWAPSRWKVASYGERICDPFLRAMGTSDVRWDEVESIQSVGVRDTVDVEVSGTHIIGGDLISHNSTLSACISNYEMYKLLKRGDPAKFYEQNPGAVISILNVAPTDEQASVVFDMTQSMAMRCPYIKDRCLHPTMTYFDLQTDEDRTVHGKPRASLASISGGCSSNALRGQNAIVIIMDEMAHFIDNNGRFSGSEVYNALEPSRLTFRRDGKVICISSPYAKFGKFYELWQDSFQNQEMTLAFKMYSAMVNPTKCPTEILKSARKSDRTKFMCEYGGEFSDTITAWIEDEAEFKQCIVNRTPTGRGVHDISYFFGIDLGFKNDGSAVSIVHKENNKIILDYSNVWYSGASDVWEDDKSIYQGCNKFATLDLIRMSDIVDEIKELVKWFPAKGGIFDQHNGYALAELFLKEHLQQFEMENFSDTINSEVYQLAKRLYAEKLLEIYEHPILTKEMLTLEAEKRSRDKVIVRAPVRRGAHDDMCLTPETLIVTKKGVKCISECTVEDEVITHKGSFRLIENVSKRPVSEQIFEIRSVHLGTLRLTGNHPVYVLRNGVKQFVPACEVTRKDKMVYSFNMDVKTPDDLDVLDFVEKRSGETNRASIDCSNLTCDGDWVRFDNPSSNPIRRFIKVSKDLCRLLGYYVAEGSGGNHGISFSFAADEVEYHEDVKNLMRTCFGITKVSEQVSEVGTGLQIQFNSFILKDVFGKLFGNGAGNKKLPSWMMEMQFDLQEEFLKGFWRGDGCYTNKSFLFTTTSVTLAYQVRDMLLRLGVGCGISCGIRKGQLHRFRGNRYYKMNYDLYNLRIQSTFDMTRISDILGEKIPDDDLDRCRNTSERMIRFGELYCGIRSIRNLDYTGDVYNLTVPIDSSYTTVHGTVHNSDSFVRAVWLCYKNFKDNPKKYACGAGGIGSITQQPGGGRLETQASFIVKRLRQHGEHPRGLYNSHRKASMLAGR